MNTLPCTTAPRSGHTLGDTAHARAGGAPAPWGRGLALALAMALTASAAMAQTVYRYVGPDGRVTFSDRPPANAPVAVTDLSTGAPPKPGTDSSPLPYELQQLTQKYPVTLYSAQRCGPCDAGRKLLAARGIPFTEKTVNTREDIEAFERINPDNSLPLVTIGGQKVLGFSAQEWAQYLDNAGYPKTSALPSRYAQPPAQPLAPLPPASATDAAAARANAPASAPTAPPRPKPTVLPSNPAGIRF